MKLLLTLDKILKLTKNIWNGHNYDVTYNEILILMTLEENKTLSSICSALLTDRSQIFKSLDVLVKKDFVLKNKNGGKASIYNLTKKGSEVIKEAYSIRTYLDTVGIQFPELLDRSTKNALQQFEEDLNNFLNPSLR